MICRTKDRTIRKQCKILPNLTVKYKKLGFLNTFTGRKTTRSYKRCISSSLNKFSFEVSLDGKRTKTSIIYEIEVRFGNLRFTKASVFPVWFQKLCDFNNSVDFEARILV